MPIRLQREHHEMHELTQRFTDALHRLHTDRDPGPLADLFADGATLTKLGDQHEAHGQQGARQFWQDYRDVFDDLEVTFTHSVQDQRTAVLEWSSDGSLRSGRSFSYRGVSVLVGDGEQIEQFRTYYDSAAFVAEPTA